MKTAAVIVTRVQTTGKMVKLSSTIFLMDGDEEERLVEKKTIAAKGWQRASYRWHEAVTKEIIEATAERAFIVRASWSG